MTNTHLSYRWLVTESPLSKSLSIRDTCQFMGKCELLYWEVLASLNFYFKIWKNRSMLYLYWQLNVWRQNLWARFTANSQGVYMWVNRKEGELTERPYLIPLCIFNKILLIENLQKKIILVFALICIYILYYSFFFF